MKIHSKGNDKIYHETIEFISRCKNNNIKPNLIVIQWSVQVGFIDTPLKKSRIL